MVGLTTIGLPLSLCTPPKATATLHAVNPTPNIREVLRKELQTLPLPAPTINNQLGIYSLKNAHTNIYATHPTKTLNTTILNQPITIKLTPTKYEFNYGDGTTQTTTTPGHPTPKIDPDTPTPTSHQYTQTGTYTITLTTHYTAQYTTNNTTYTPIPGTTTTTSNPLTITIYRTKHLNVQNPCTPTTTNQPGCTTP